MSSHRETIKVGDLVRQKNSLRGDYRYGHVLTTAYPHRDDTEWTDHKVFWYDGGEVAFEWCGHLEVVSDE